MSWRLTSEVKEVTTRMNQFSESLIVVKQEEKMMKFVRANKTVDGKESIGDL